MWDSNRAAIKAHMNILMYYTQTFLAGEDKTVAACTIINKLGSNFEKTWNWHRIWFFDHVCENIYFYNKAIHQGQHKKVTAYKYNVAYQRQDPDSLYILQKQVYSEHWKISRVSLYFGSFSKWIWKLVDLDLQEKLWRW